MRWIIPGTMRSGSRGRFSIGWISGGIDMTMTEPGKWEIPREIRGEIEARAEALRLKMGFGGLDEWRASIIASIVLIGLDAIKSREPQA